MARAVRSSETTQSRDLIVLDAEHAAQVRAPLVRVVDHVCDAAMCEALVARIEALGPSFAPITTGQGFVNRPDIRNNDRVMFDDAALAKDLFERLSPHLPQTRHGALPNYSPRRPPGEGALWRAVGLNERFRGYRYAPGQRFAPHHDGAFVREAHERSGVTVLLYLNEVTGGGETNILQWGVTYAPARGAVLLFDHNLLHEGAEVTEGHKYVLRTDVMYRRDASAAASGG